MLPSNGYFKHIFCPYDKAKLCHRPYCHYKHAETGSGEKALDEVEDTGYLFDAKPAENVYQPTFSGYSPVSSTGSYIPSPVKPVGILKVNRNNQPSYYNSLETPSMVIPEYNPTPISQLNGSNPGESFKYNALPDNRKKKFVEEYDPTMVTYKCLPRKTVMFADEAGIALDDANEPVADFSSEEEMEDLASAPKFSDDDLDDNYRNVDRFSAPKPAVKPAVEDDTEEEEVLDEKNIDEFSIVDKILVGSKKSDKLINNFKKTALLSKKEKEDKVGKKKIEAKKHKAKVDSNDVYDCDVKKPLKKVTKPPSDFDAIMSMASFDDLKDNEMRTDDETNKSKQPSKKLKTKSDDSPRTKKSDLSTKEERSSSLKTKKSSSDKKTKDVTHTSKHSDKSTDSKSKHSSSSDKSNSNGKSSKTEKHSSTVSVTAKTEKSSSSTKSSKSDKSLTNSSKDKSSSPKKLSKQDKHSASSSKSAREKEAKLQDEKVSSSSIAKRIKHEQNAKHLSKTSDTLGETSKLYQSKLKTTNKDEKPKTKASSKRKAEDSDDSEPICDKPKSKTFSCSSKRPRNDSDDDISSTDGGFDDVIDISSSESEEDTEEQCKRIFEETFVPNDESVSSDKEDSSSTSKPTFIDLTSSRKQRLAHAGATTAKSGPSVQKPAFRPTRNPGQVMLERFAKIRAAQAELNAAKPKGPVTNSPSRGKTRISIAPNHSLLLALAEKNRLDQSSNSFSPLPSTVSKTLKVTKRVAHIPDVALKPRPVIPIDYGSKVPTVARQKFLNAFIDEFLKLSGSEEEAYENALEEENNAYGRSSSKAIYMNVASNTLNRLRQRVAACTDGAAKKSETVSSTTNPSAKTVSHETLLNGPQAQRTSFSIERKKAIPTPELKGIALYEHLMTYVLSEEQLKENGYPFPHATELGRAVIEGIYANRNQYCNDPFKRTCCRCQKIYYVNVDGDYVRDEECDFHWGRPFKRRIAGAIESRYTCCQGDSESDGCCVGTGHVFEGSEAHAMKGYVNTLPKTPPPDKYYGIYALDCEMCYTTAGVELTRISVIGPDCKPVYETYVKPQNKVLDFNTRFSGITEENLKNVRTTIRDVQAVLLCMFNSRTILIGHSLESDFKALKLFHKTVVDTSVVFPHKLGLPFKRALRNLSSEKLNKIIQNDVGGHDSAEDAVACMELMIYKIKEDLKGNR